MRARTSASTETQTTATSTEEFSVAGLLGGMVFDGDGFRALADKEDLVFDELPVYADEFPKDTGGLLNPVTDAQWARMRDWHRQFMEYYLPGQEVEQVMLEETSAMFSEVGEVGVITGCSGQVNVLTDVWELSDTSSDEKIIDEVKGWLTDEQVLKAACSYVGIDDPVVRVDREYSSNGTVEYYSIRIYQQGATAMETMFNADLRSIELNVLADAIPDMNGNVRVGSPATREVKGIYAGISYETAEAQVLAGNGWAAGVGGGWGKSEPDGEFLGVDIVYRTPYEQAYSAPFYRFAFIKRDDWYESQQYPVKPYVYYYVSAVEFPLAQ